MYRIIIFVGLFFISSQAWATTYYVRDGGGTAAQCAGTTNHTLAGASGTACAFSNPGYALGYNCQNGGGSCGVAGVMGSGDTLSIDGDSDTSPGSQAQYYIGYGSSQMPSCTNGSASECTMGAVPSSVTIIGTGTHKPQLYAPTFPWQVLSLTNNSITLQWIELATHQTCGYSSPDTSCTNGEGSNRTSDGILMGGSGITLTDVYIHGFSRYGIVITGMSGTNTFTRVYLIGNGYGGFTLGNGDSSANSGTLVWNQPIVDWNGCLESYPLTSGIDSPTDHTKCYGQSSNGYGDGVAFGPSGSQNAGNWTVTGPGSISFNTQDGLDTLHGTGNGTIQVDKMRFEGNAGNQVKMNASTVSFTNNLVVADCGWWQGSANVTSGWADSCRALGDAILFDVTNGSTTNLFNNTVLSNGNITLESKDFNSTGCNGSTNIYEKNNIIYGGYAWFDDTTWNGSGGNSKTTYLYNAGNDGNGSGTCGSITWQEDYNIVTGTKGPNSNCSGAHDKCGTSPSFTGTVPMGTSGGALNTYYQGTSAITQIGIQTGSAAKGAGVTGLTYWNNSNDYYNNARPSPPSMGGIEYNSLAAGGYLCFFNSDCASNICVSNSCTSSGGGSSSGGGGGSGSSFQSILSGTAILSGNSYL